MVKKLLLISMSYVFIGLTISVIQSCNWKYDSYICDIDFTGLNENYSDRPDDLTNEIGFQIRSVENCKTALNRTRLNFFSPSYAMTKCAEWQNSLDISTYSIKFDKRVVYNSDTINPNIDILKNAVIRNGMTINKDEQCKSIYSTIVFTSKLKEDLRFESGEYNVTFSCQTTDGKQFVKQRKVIFKK